MADTTLARAQGGDGDAFRELIDPYRRELQVHCYRILGSAQDAEDVLQEALLSAWRSIGSFDGGSLRAWLYRIATTRSLNHLRDQSRRPRTAVPAWLSPAVHPVPAEDPSWLEPYPDALVDEATPGPEARYEARESIALSFVSALQRVPAQQRAVLVLRDVLGFPAAEAADVLGTSTASVNHALLRARGTFRAPEDRDLVPLPHSTEERAVAERFVEAFESVDIDQVVSLLTEDARFAMPPEPIEVHGRSGVGEFVSSLPFWGRPLKLVATRANGQPAFGYYVLEQATSVFQGNGLLVLALHNDRVASITRFGGPGVLARFGLPTALQP
ncbi:MAG TPA: RNA polymerase subunit sigma-70 [Acidimicrobiales bacterium]|nr:RNA polymerase subunit sigma-70 [Acidimicrobiales bacterium]